MEKNLSSDHSTRFDIPLLILANFIANFLFIRKYSLYSDDWSAIAISSDTNTSYLTLFLDAQRPLLYVTDKFVSSLPLNVFSLQVCGFLLSSLLLILLYLIVRKITIDCDYAPGYVAFLICLLYVVLFNKDEIYPWLIVSTCNMVGYLLYAISILGYLYRGRKPFIIISLIAFFLGLLTYEIGLALPVFYMVYEFLDRKRIKESLLYLIPLILILFIRSTEWFGYGSVRLVREFIGLDPFLFLLHTGLFLFTSVLIIANQIQFSCVGWSQMSYPVMAAVILADLILISLIIRIIMTIGFREKSSIRIIFIFLTGLIVFSIPYILNSGGTPTRGYIFIDLFVAGLIVFAIIQLGDGRLGKILYLFLLFISLLICQGLYLNWVISGDITDAIAENICTNQDEIRSFDYIYFNSTSFTTNMPNSLSTAYHPTREDLFRLKREFLAGMGDDLVRRIGKEDNPGALDSGYEQYYNAKCLDTWALSAMLLRCGLGDKTLVYGGNWYGNFPLSYNQTILQYQEFKDNHPDGPVIQVNRSQVWEISYPVVRSSHQRVSPF